MSSWLLLQLVSEAIDDPPTATSLACTCSYAPPVPIRLIRAKVIVELCDLERKVDLISFLWPDINPFAVDESRITEWCRVEDRDVFHYNGEDSDGLPDIVSGERHIPLLRPTGMWESIRSVNELRGVMWS